MFEDEVAMEKRSSIFPLLLMLCLAAVVAAGVVWVVLEVKERAPLTVEQAGPLVAAALQGPGSAVTRFSTGLMPPNYEFGKAGDPGYRLLAKAGIVKLGKAGKDGSVPVSLTAQGEKMLAGIAGVKKSEKNGTVSYQVPLAGRQLVDIAGVTMTGVNTAAIEYTWKWVPNPLADAFDVAGPLVKSFSTYERKNLIDKYGADFYHGNVNKSTLGVTREKRGWKIGA
jgi:hypothetical protein